MQRRKLIFSAGAGLVSIHLCSAVSAAPIVYKVETQNCDAAEDSVGTGFLGLLDDNTPAVFTALHVVNRCKAVKFYRLTCDEDGATREAEAGAAVSRARRDAILAWPGLDLVAFPLLPTDPDLGRLGAIQLSRTIQRPAFNTSLKTLGLSDLNNCPPNVGIVRYTTKVKPLVDHIQKTTRLKRSQIAGALADDSDLLVYFSSAGPGVSGGPVFLVDGENADSAVIAVHDGGASDGTTVWAVLLSRTSLRDPLRTTLGQLNVPDASASKFGQSARFDGFSADSSFEEPARGAEIFGLVALHGTQANRNGFSVSAGVFIPFKELTPWAHGSSVGFRAHGGFRHGFYRQRFLGPLGESTILEEHRETTNGFEAELGPYVRLFELTIIRVAFSFGLRLELDHFTNLPDQVSDLKWGLGPAVRAHLCPAFIWRRVGLCLDFFGHAVRNGSLAFRYEGTGQSVEQEDEWLLTGGVGAGASYVFF